MEKIQTGYVTVLNKSMGTSRMERKKKIGEKVRGTTRVKQDSDSRESRRDR